MEKENQLLEQRELRQNLIERTEVLDKVKEVVSGMMVGDYMLLSKVANYYEVGEEAINSVVKRNREELITNGLVSLKRSEIANVFESSDWTFKSGKGKTEVSNGDISFNVTNTGTLLFIRRTILNIGMLLQESPIAKEIRTILLDMSENIEAIKEVIDDIDQEDILILKVVRAKNESERMIALSSLTNYRDEKERKITEEKDIAIGKVTNLTKSDATWGVREAKTNLGVKEKQFTNWMIHNKFVYRQHKNGDEKGKPSGRIKANSQYTKEPTRYFTDINQIDRLGNPHTQTVITVEGIEYFRTRIKDINGFV